MRHYYTEEEFQKRKSELFMAKMRTAISHKIPFDIRIDDLVWPSYCPVLGYELDYSKKPRGAVHNATATFDSVDPTLGYVKGNVRIISWKANRLKNDGTAEEFRKIAAYIDGSIYL